MNRQCVRFMLPLLGVFVLVTVAYAGGWAIITVNHFPDTDLELRRRHLSLQQPKEFVSSHRKAVSDAIDTLRLTRRPQRKLDSTLPASASQRITSKHFSEIRVSNRPRCQI